MALPQRNLSTSLTCEEYVWVTERASLQGVTRRVAALQVLDAYHAAYGLKRPAESLFRAVYGPHPGGKQSGQSSTVWLSPPSHGHLQRTVDRIGLPMAAGLRLILRTLLEQVPHKELQQAWLSSPRHAFTAHMVGKPRFVAPQNERHSLTLVVGDELEDRLLPFSARSNKGQALREAFETAILLGVHDRLQADDVTGMMPAGRTPGRGLKKTIQFLCPILVHDRVQVRSQVIGSNLGQACRDMIVGWKKHCDGAYKAWRQQRETEDAKAGA